MPEDNNQRGFGQGYQGRDENDAMSDEDIASLLQQCEQLQEDVEALEREAATRSQLWRQEKGGARLPLLLQSQEETLRGLDDDDPNLRELAIHLAVTHWHLDKAIGWRIRQMALEDTSGAVRCMALSKIANCFRGIHENGIRGEMAKIVLDNARDLEERKMAYLSMLQLGSDGRICSIETILTSFPENVDWEYVRAQAPVDR